MPATFQLLEIERDCAELHDPLSSLPPHSLCMEKIKEPNTPGNATNTECTDTSRVVTKVNCSIVQPLALNCPHVYVLDEFKALIKRGSAWDEMEAEIAEPWLPGSSSRLSTGRKGERTKAISNYTSPALFTKTIHWCFDFLKHAVCLDARVKMSQNVVAPDVPIA